VRRGRAFPLLHVALLPMTLAVLFCYIGTVLWSVRISTTSSHTFPAHDFVGLAQYERLFNSDAGSCRLRHGAGSAPCS